jgi:hypothetical protein
MAALTPKGFADAAARRSLAALVIAAPPAESDLDGSIYAVVLAHVDAALGHVHQRARERAGR